MQRLKGISLKQEAAQFGECAWYLMQRKNSVINKLKFRWKAGIWSRVREESGETLIGTKEGKL